MNTSYILIDFENVQPSNLKILKDHAFKILVFVGTNQTKLPIDLVTIMQDFGKNAQYIKIAGSGKNALDFHIAYYIGMLTAKEPNLSFHIISKDTGFDPLIKHLNSNKIKAKRYADLSEIRILKISNKISNTEKINAIVKNLTNRGQSKPRKVATLKNTINSLFSENLSSQEIDSLVDNLIKKGFIKVKGESIAYQLAN